MLHASLDVFFRFPSDSNRRVLHPGVVLTARDEACTAELEEVGVTLEAGEELLIYYMFKSKFFQQPIRVDAVLKSAPRMVVAFRTLGEPVSANSRECFRVATNVARLTADVGDEQGCPVNDVSATGFSFVSKAHYAIGANVPVTIVHEGRAFRGAACVQSVRELDRGRVRYGMYCVSGNKVEGNLDKGLALISAAFQRAQLRRLARA